MISSMRVNLPDRCYHLIIRVAHRAFFLDDDEKRAAYETQKGVCPICGGHFEYEEMEGDHIVPLSRGGKTVPENLQMLCRRCNATKSDR